MSAKDLVLRLITDGSGEGDNDWLQITAEDVDVDVTWSARNECKGSRAATDN